MRYDFLMAAMLVAFATFLIVGAAYLLSRRERLLGLKLLSIFALLNVLFSISYAGYLLADVESRMIGYVRMMYAALPFLMPVWYLISIQQRYDRKRLAAGKTIALFIFPSLCMIAAFLYPRVVTGDLPWYRTLFYIGHDVATLPGENWDGFIGICFEKGIFYYALAGYSLIIAVLSCINFFVTSRKRAGLARRRSLFLFSLALVALPLLILTVMKSDTVLVDFSAFFTDAIAFSAFLALFKYEMFDLIPLAYYELFRKSEYPIVILDEAKAVVTLNAAAERAFGRRKGGDLDRFDLNALHGGDPAARELAAGRDAELVVAIEGKKRYFRAAVTLLGRSKKRPTGSFVVYQDVTSHKDEMRRMEQMAAYDDLTKIYNRRYFFRKATEAFDQAVAARENVRVMMFDLDDFKEVNDIYGHQAGDTILAQLAKVVSGLLGEGDIFARYGGEEFVIFRKNVPEAEARALEQRICDAISTHAFTYQRRMIRVTGSFGVAGSRDAVNKPLERYIKEADDAMYVSKTAGKNAVSYAPDLK